jgi:regulator of protease activity HflC (stomatin/prohibitin superfamily)
LWLFFIPAITQILYAYITYDFFFFFFCFLLCIVSTAILLILLLPLSYPSQAAITRDNVSVEVSGNVYVQFVDAEKAAYGARNPLYAVVQHAQSAMRSAIGEMELDEILHNRAKLNTLIKGSVQEAAVAWGIAVRRYEITEVTPDEQIRLAMDKQAAAERNRREMVLQAEGQKQRAQLSSEGVKISLTNESEGNLIRVRNEAEAAKSKLLLEAEGEAEAIRIKAAATAQAISVIAAELVKAGGQDAAKLAIAKQYIEMYGEMGSKSNTIMFNDRPADINSLFAQAALAIRGTTSAVGPDAVDITNITSNSSGSGNNTFETTEKTSLP